MKRLLIAAAIVAVFFLVALPAHAGAPGSPFIQPPPANMIQSPAALDNVAAGIAQRAIAARGWCDRPVPKPKPDTVAVYYVRDRAGQCVSRFVKG